MKVKRIVPLILVCCLLSGCWDKIEINRRAFVSTIVIDVGENIDKQEELKDIKPNEIFKEDEYKKITVTFGIPNISELGPDKGGSSNEEYITVEAFSMQDAITELAAKSSRSIDIGQTRLLIMSNEVLNYPEVVKEFLDFFNRQPDINRTMLTLITKGKAQDYTKFEPQLEKNIGSFIAGIMENSTKNSSILPMKLNELLIQLYQYGSVVVPTIEFDEEEKDKVVLSGVSLIKDYKVVGELTPIETASLEILRGTIEGGKETILIDGHPLEFEIRGIDRKISLVDDKDPKKLKFKIDINLEGQLKGYYMSDTIFSEAKLEKIQDSFNDVIERRNEKLARIIQEEYGVDVIGFKEYVEKFKPNVYKKIENDWDEVYKNANIDLTVSTKVRRIGVTK